MAETERQPMLRVEGLNQPLWPHPGAQGRRPGGGGRRAGGAGRRQRRRQDHAAAHALGVQPASGGRVVFEGQEITRLKPHARVRLGIAQVPEGRQVWGPLMRRGQPAPGRGAAPRPREVAQDLERVYGMFPILKERRRQAAGTLSGGQQQMLAMGRAPADAAAAAAARRALDGPGTESWSEQILASVAALKRQGVTVFLVEQNAFAALKIAGPWLCAGDRQGGAERQRRGSAGQRAGQGSLSRRLGRRKGCARPALCGWQAPRRPPDSAAGRGGGPDAAAPRQGRRPHGTLSSC